MIEEIARSLENTNEYQGHENRYTIRYILSSKSKHYCLISRNGYGMVISPTMRSKRLALLTAACVIMGNIMNTPHQP